MTLNMPDLRTELSLRKLDPTLIDSTLSDEGMNLADPKFYENRKVAALTIPSGQPTTQPIIIKDNFTLPTGSTIPPGSQLGVDITLNHPNSPQSTSLSHNSQIPAGTELHEPMIFKEGDLIINRSQLPIEVTVRDKDSGVIQTIPAYTDIPANSIIENFPQGPTFIVNNTSPFTKDIILPQINLFESISIGSDIAAPGTLIPAGSLLDQDYKFEAGDQLLTDSILPFTVKVQGNPKKIKLGDTIPAGSVLEKIHGTKTRTLYAGKPTPADFEVPSIAGKNIYISSPSFKPGDTVPSGTILTDDFIIPVDSIFEQDTILPDDAQIKDPSGNTTAILAGNTIPANSQLATEFKILSGTTLNADLKIPTLTHSRNSISVSTDQQLNQITLIEGASLPLGTEFSVDITVKDPSGNITTLPARTPVTTDLQVAAHTVIDEVITIPAGQELPFQIITTQDYSTTQPTTLKTGFQLPAGIPDLAVTNIIYPGDVSYPTPSNLKLGAWEKRKISHNPEGIFKSIFLRDLQSSPFKKDTFDRLASLYDQASSSPTNSKYYQSKLCLKIAEGMEQITGLGHITSDADYQEIIKSLKEYIKEQEKTLKDKQDASQVADFGGLLESTSILNPFTNKLSEELRQEIFGTQKQINSKIKDSLDAVISPGTSIEENKRKLAEFENNEASKLLKEGANEVLDRLNQIYNQRINYRKNNLGGLHKTIGKIQNMHWTKKLLLGTGITTGGILLSTGAPAILPFMPVAHAVIQGGVINSLFGNKVWGTLRKIPSDQVKSSAIDIESQIRQVTSRNDSDRSPYAVDVIKNTHAELTKRIEKGFSASSNSKRLQDIKSKINSATNQQDSDKYLKLYQKTYADILSSILEDFYEEQLTAIVKQRKFRNVHRATEFALSVAARTPFVWTGISSAGSGFFNAIPDIKLPSMPDTNLGSNLTTSTNWKNSFTSIFGGDIIPEASADVSPSSPDSPIPNTPNTDNVTAKVGTTTGIKAEIATYQSVSTNPDTAIASSTADAPINPAEPQNPTKIQDTIREATAAITPDLPSIPNDLLAKDFVEPISQIPEIPKEGFKFHIPEDSLKIPKNTGNGDLLSALTEGTTLKDSDPSFRQIIDTFAVGGKELSYQDQKKFIQILSKSNPGLSNYIFNNQEITFSNEALDFLSQKTGISKEALFSRIRTPENYEKFISKLWQLKK